MGVRPRCRPRRTRGRKHAARTKPVTALTTTLSDAMKNPRKSASTPESQPVAGITISTKIGMATSIEMTGVNDVSSA